MAVNLTDEATMTTMDGNTITFTTMTLASDVSRDPMAVQVFAVVLMTILIVFTFQGNLWIIITITVTPQLRSSLANILIVNLCTIDLLASIVAMPLSALSFLRGQDVIAKEVCTVNGFFNTLVMVCSMLSLCAVSVERYYSISLPMHYAGHATPCLYLIVVISIWCTSVIVSILPLAGLASYSYQPAKRACTYTSQDNTTSGGAFTILIFIISFLVPSLIMITMYVSIFRVARKAAATVRPRPRPCNAVNGAQTEHTRQPIFTISTHTALANTQTKTSPADIKRVVTVNNSGYSKRTPNETSVPTEDCTSRPGEVTHNESLQLPLDKYDNKQDEICQGKMWLHDHLHRGKVHRAFLCICCRERASNRCSDISVSHVESPDSQLTATIHKTEADGDTRPKNNFHDIAVVKVKANHMKALRTLMIIVVTNLIVWAPYFVCQVYELAHGQTVSQAAGVIITWLSFVSYTTNPCLYGLMNRTIREELSQLLKTVCIWGCCCTCSPGTVTWRRPCHTPPSDTENEEDGFGEGENFYQFLQRTQASDTTPPLNLDTERNR